MLPLEASDWALLLAGAGIGHPSSVTVFSLQSQLSDSD
jgi:hypothetical protein